MVEVNEETIAPNPPLNTEDPARELNSRVVTVQPLINLEEEPVATDVEEEPKPIVDLTTV